MSNNTGGALLAIFGLMGMSASAGVAAYFLMSEDDAATPTPTPTPTPTEIVKTPDAIVPADCSGDVKIMKKACHNPDTGDVFDGTPDKCGSGKELWIPDPSAPGYVAAIGDGTCPGELRDCSVECPAPCEGGEWKQDPTDYCKIISYDDANPPQKVETRLNGTTACGTGVVNEVLDETRGNFVEAKGLGGCVKTRVGACDVACPAGMTASSGCAYYANRQKSANGCMRVDANGNALEYNPDGSNNVGCGESGKQEFFYLPINASTCGRLSDWEPCSGDPCPVDCVGNWRHATPSNPEGWETCVGNCGEQPQKMRKYHISQVAQHGGVACPHADEHTEFKNCGSITPCCEIGEWQDGTCASNGFMTQTRVLTENSSGACSGIDTTRSPACCYQGGDWTAQGPCGRHQSGKQKYTQTVAGNCPSGTDTKYEDCNNCKHKIEYSINNFCHIGNKIKVSKYTITEPASGTGTCSYPTEGKMEHQTLVSGNCEGTVGTKNMFLKNSWSVDRKSFTEYDQLVKNNGGWTSDIDSVKW